MSEEEHQNALMQCLRNMTCGWLQALLQSSHGTPHANYPFSEGIPFSGTPLQANFSWNDFYGRNVHHNFPIVFEFIQTSFVQEGPQKTRLMWKITSCTFPVARGVDRLIATLKLG